MNPWSKSKTQLSEQGRNATENEMPRCMYCSKEIEESTSSIEHVIPQFLGGAYAPDQFKTRLVCRRCNNNLGLFVDAAFGKDWIVSNNLAHLAREAYRCEGETSTSGVPLICMGISDLSPPDMKEGEVCESWLGPNGEQVYLIRPSDEQLYWYSGGNPITAKQQVSRAYFQFSENSHRNPRLAWFSFRDAFEDRKVRKIMVTQVDGADPASIGFVEPDGIDRKRATYFQQACSESTCRKNNIPLSVHFDHRFLGKLALGVAAAVFGESILETAYSRELRNLLWYRGDGCDGNAPAVFGATAYTKQFDTQFLQFTGLVDAVVVTLAPIGDGIALTLNIGTKQVWVVKCADFRELDDQQRAAVTHGCVLVLSKAAEEAYELYKWVRSSVNM